MSDISYSSNSDESSKSRITSESDSDRDEMEHSDDLVYACPNCDAKCSTAHELNDHNKIHTYAERTKSPIRPRISASQPSNSFQHTSENPDKKRAASTSPNSGNIRRRKENWSKISENYVSFKL